MKVHTAKLGKGAKWRIPKCLVCRHEIEAGEAYSYVPVPLYLAGCSGHPLKLSDVKLAEVYAAVEKILGFGPTKAKRTRAPRPKAAA